MNEFDIFLNVSGWDESSVFMSHIPRKKLDAKKNHLFITSPTHQQWHTINIKKNYTLYRDLRIQWCREYNSLWSKRPGLCKSTFFLIEMLSSADLKMCGGFWNMTRVSFFKVQFRTWSIIWQLDNFISRMSGLISLLNINCQAETVHLNFNAVTIDYFIVL